MTDWNILVLAVEQETGCSPTDADIARGLDFAARRYPELLAAAEAPLALDGAREIRGALLDRKHVVSLVTGNVEAIAEAKLAAADLSEYCSPQQGGFGDQSRLRPELVRIAVARARGAGWAGEQVAVVGDTPRDIDCAHANGSLAVAVTTGPYGRDALGAADLVIDSLAEILMLLDG
jgi:phosphoglycolate phosphatase-like HAD superfamily hydrolase